MTKAGAPPPRLSLWLDDFEALPHGRGRWMLPDGRPRDRRRRVLGVTDAGTTSG